MVAEGWVAEWQAAGRMEVGMVQDEQAEWLSMATTALAALLRAKIAQLVVSAVGVVARVR